MEYTKKEQNDTTSEKKWEVKGWRNSTIIYAQTETEAIKEAMTTGKVGMWEFPEAKLIK